jgi:hypothetical protein
MSLRVIHAVDYASQPDLQIRCDGAWTTPHGNNFKSEPKPFPVGVYEASSEYLYTFDEEKVTCAECIRLKDTKPHYPRE